MKNLKSMRGSLLALGVKRNRKLEQELLELTAEKAEDLRKRFWMRAEVKSNEECWDWKLSHKRGGYGQFSIHSKPVKASRLSYILHYKKIIPEGMFVCHTCDNKRCVNPYHLWVGTNRDNQMDSVKKGKNYMPVGELAWACKLKSEQVLEIRKMHSEGMCQRRIAEKFSVGYKAINKIVLRHRWKHI